MVIEKSCGRDCFYKISLDSLIFGTNATLKWRFCEVSETVDLVIRAEDLSGGHLHIINYY